jgi:sporulation protein YlmC with PRC-barrel domain
MASTRQSSEVLAAQPYGRVMGFNRPTWLPGLERRGIAASRSKHIAEFREQRERRARDYIAARELEGSLISLAAILGTDVKDSAGVTIGQLRDVVVRWTKGSSYPAVTAIVVRTGRREVLIGARWIEASPQSSVRLRSSKAYARAVERHPADVALAHDVLDRQIVDAEGVQIVRPADVYLATVDGRVDLVGIEIGVRALVRRLGPKRLRSRFQPERVIDWATIRSFAPARADEVRSSGRRSDLAGRAGSGLVLDSAAGEVRRLHASDIEAALRASQTETAEESR